MHSLAWKYGFAAALFGAAAWLASPNLAAQPQPKKPVFDPKSAEVWKKAGGTFGVMQLPWKPTPLWTEDKGGESITLDHIKFGMPSADAIKQLPTAPGPIIVDIWGLDWSDADMASLSKQKTIRALFIRSPKVTDAGLAGIAPLTDLHYFSLPPASPVSGAGLKHLEKATKLQSLVLPTGFGGESWKQLAKFPALNQVTIGVGKTEVGAPLAAAEVAEIAKLKALERFAIPGRATDEAVATFAGMKSLRSLNLSKSKLTDASLKNLGSMKGLERLDLSEVEVTANGLTELANNKSIIELHLGSCPVTDEMLATVATMKGLRMLVLSGTKITDASLAKVAQLDNLVTLMLSRTAVTDEGIKQLATLKKLKGLFLNETKVTKDGVAALKTSLPTTAILGPPR